MTAASTARSFDLGAPARAALTVATATVLGLSLYALGRAALGVVPAPAYAREVALIVHLATVIPALPLGLYVLLARKGDARHKLLGKIWLALMVTTALASFAIRHNNPGNLSWIHIFSVLTLTGAVRIVYSARARNFAAHKRTVLLVYGGALLVAGLFTFVPGRIMFRWLVG